MRYLNFMTPECLYVHIPFCPGKCRYCDFTSIKHDESVSSRYVDALRSEMRLRASGKLRTLYVGGGTPTVLSAKSLRKIVSSVREFCTLAPDAEITCESNPGTLTEEKAEALVDCGVTRLSLGVQSFDNGLLKFLGRTHDSDEARSALRLAGQMQVELSLDLMYGVPGQDMDTWTRSLEEALSFGPDHISAYELTPEEGTPLMELIKKGAVSMPHEEDVFPLCFFRRKLSGLVNG